ncbi:deoxynucleoside kinase [Piscinibacter terrae]|uniref:Deoxynucleoside kinase n=1 Tax=Piscinibacter terrae TaxID=2496871 RepID=A0A3N7HUG0_9BURK|nr:deoxynucleoside kinase [Albitalea terrae]RQP25978.1 deoxynucleoside kinase [Albitalea terrae]
MTNLLDRFRHIAIEGPIGVGKSSLARRLGAHLGADLLLEKAEENPFLERFYRDRTAYAFQTQLFFLFQRVKQMQEIAQPGMFSRGIVSDFVFAKDALFARMNLDDEEYRLYTQIHGHMAQSLPRPDLVIWLQAEPQALLQRIGRRGIAMEQDIDAAYLQRLCDAYVEHFRSDGTSPVLTVPTESFNPAGNDEDFRRLVDALDQFRGPAGVLDPAAA